MSEPTIVIPADFSPIEPLDVLHGTFPKEQVENVYNFDENPLYISMLEEAGFKVEVGHAITKLYGILLPLYEFEQWDSTTRTDYLDRIFIRPIIEKHQDKRILLHRLIVTKEYDWKQYPMVDKHYAYLYMELK